MRTPQAAIVGQGMVQEAGGAVDALMAIRPGWHVRGRQPAEPGTRQHARHHGRGDTQRLRNAAHRVAVPAQADGPRPPPRFSPGGSKLVLDGRDTGAARDPLIRRCRGIASARRVLVRKVLPLERSPCQKRPQAPDARGMEPAIAIPDPAHDERGDPEVPSESLGRRDWTRTNDPHHVKVVL